MGDGTEPCGADMELSEALLENARLGNLVVALRVENQHLRERIAAFHNFDCAEISETITSAVESAFLDWRRRVRESARAALLSARGEAN